MCKAHGFVLIVHVVLAFITFSFTTDLMVYMYEGKNAFIEYNTIQIISRKSTRSSFLEELA